MKNNHYYVITVFIVLLTLISYDYSNSKEIDQEVRDISAELLCPVCQGQSVSESNAQLAVDMRNTIKKQLEEGKNKQQILDYFVQRYGESILASPPARGINILIWLLPIAGILIIGLLLGSYLYKSRRESKQNIDNTAVSDSKFAQIEEDMKNYDL